MIHIDHVAVGCANLYEASDRMRRETGLGFYDGGWFPTVGDANKIFPLGGANYMEIESIVDAKTVNPKAPGYSFFSKAWSGEDVFTGLCLGVDNMEELQDLAVRHRSVVSNPNVGGKVSSSGRSSVVYHAPPVLDCWPKGLPDCYLYTNMTVHPSGQPTTPFPGLRQPLGIFYVEMGGTEREMTEWLGVPASTMPMKFNGKTKGVYAVAIKIDGGPEIVIRRKNVVELL